MGFYEDINSSYGPETTRDLKLWSTNNNKLASAKNRRIFLLECKRQELIPRHITTNIKNVMGLFEYNNSKLNMKIKDFNDKTTKKILNLEISQINHKIKLLERHISEIQRKLQHLPENILREYKSRLNISYNKKFHQIKDTNIKKLNSLQERNITGTGIKTQNKWIKNLTTKQIPQSVNNLLSLGSKFIIQSTKKDVNIENIIADTEYILQGIPDERKNIQRARVTNAITNYIHKDLTSNSQINKCYQETKIFLKTNDDIIVLNSDKGAVTVLMEEKEYHEKIQQILDSQDFKKLPRDPTQTTQNKCNKYIGRLQQQGYITEEQAKQMKTYNSVAPRIYGNPKIHKEGNPIRPIVSSINSPMNSLSKFVADILKSAYNTDNPYYVKDSFQFAQDINDFEIPDDYRLISLDVVNLFGNLDKGEILEIIRLKWNIIKDHTTVDMELFIEIIEFLLNKNYCTFKQNFYLQVFGCAMGSKLTPILAQYVMDHVVDSCLIKLSFRVLFIKKFVDDIILAVPEDHIQTTLECFNSHSANLQFTIEIENNEQAVPFLDTKALRHNNRIKLKWHRKDTHSNKIIHFQSDHNINIKINTVKQMKNRINKICHDTFKQEGIKRLQEIFKQNSYPNGLLNKLLYANDETQTSRQIENQNTTTSRVHIASYPNVNNLTKKLKNIFKDENVKIAVYNQKTVKNLYSRIKDPIPTPLKSNVVYEIECLGCDRSYIGQTSQCVKNRIAIHKSDITKYKERCALAIHAHNLDHRVDFGSVKVLKSEPNYHKRLIHEMIHINKTEKVINKKTDTNNLSSIYSYLLEISKYKNFYDGPVDE